MEKRELDPRHWSLEQLQESIAVYYVSIILHTVGPLSITWWLKSVNCLTLVHIHIQEIWMLSSSYFEFRIVSEHSSVIRSFFNLNTCFVEVFSEDWQPFKLLLEVVVILFLIRYDHRGTIVFYRVSNMLVLVKILFR